MTTLIENKLYCVEVPSDATEMYLNEFGSFIDYNSNNISRTLQINFYANKILGEVTKDEINFNCDGLVEKTDNPYWYSRGFEFIDYTNDSNCFNSPNESFRSLLQSKGIDTNKPNVKHVILEKV